MRVIRNIYVAGVPPIEGAGLLWRTE